MPKVFSIHAIEPRADVNFEDYEKLLLDSFTTVEVLPGWNMYLAKADRGERKGHYAIIHEFDSVEIRNQYYPAEGGQGSPEAEAVFGAAPPELAERWYALVAVNPGEIYSDYVLTRS